MALLRTTIIEFINLTRIIEKIYLPQEKLQPKTPKKSNNEEFEKESNMTITKTLKRKGIRFILTLTKRCVML